MFEFEPAEAARAAKRERHPSFALSAASSWFRRSGTIVIEARIWQRLLGAPRVRHDRT